jgi:GTP 3',8-cyclase
MSDIHRIDSHKLMYHPHRVAQWLEANDDWKRAKKIYPIYIEVSPVNHCNHRCTFCALDFAQGKKHQLDPDILKKRLFEMANLGVKSIMFAGEGEPLLYKPLPEILEHCQKAKIDTSITTNFSPFNDKNKKSIIKNCKWIKVSINAGTAKNYAEIHGVAEREFDRVLDNLKCAVDLRKELKSNCTIGTQILLVDDNAHTLIPLVETVKEIGADYLVIKPYSQHYSSHTTKYQNMDYTDYYDLEKRLKIYNSNQFKIIFRLNTMKKLSDINNRYSVCYSVPNFSALLLSDGDIYGCMSFIKDDNFYYGNINESTFQEIWESERRKKSLEYVLNELDIDNCRVNCRMDEINRYLWELRHPSDHVNFI